MVNYDYVTVVCTAKNSHDGCKPAGRHKINTLVSESAALESMYKNKENKKNYHLAVNASRTFAKSDEQRRAAKQKHIRPKRNAIY